MSARGGYEKCPVCLRFRHAEKCPVRETMALEWTDTSPDERAREAKVLA